MNKKRIATVKLAIATSTMIISTAVSVTNQHNALALVLAMMALLISIAMQSLAASDYLSATMTAQEKLDVVVHMVKMSK